MLSDFHIDALDLYNQCCNLNNVFTKLVPLYLKGRTTGRVERFPKQQLQPEDNVKCMTAERAQSAAHAFSKLKDSKMADGSTVRPVLYTAAAPCALLGSFAGAAVRHLQAFYVETKFDGERMLISVKNGTTARPAAFPQAEALPRQPRTGRAVLKRRPLQ